MAKQSEATALRRRITALEKALAEMDRKRVAAETVAKSAEAQAKAFQGQATAAAGAQARLDAITRQLAAGPLGETLATMEAAGVPTSEVLKRLTHKGELKLPETAQPKPDPVQVRNERLALEHGETVQAIELEIAKANQRVAQLMDPQLPLEAEAIITREAQALDSLSLGKEADALRSAHTARMEAETVRIKQVVANELGVHISEVPGETETLIKDQLSKNPKSLPSKAQFTTHARSALSIEAADIAAQREGFGKGFLGAGDPKADITAARGRLTADPVGAAAQAQKALGRARFRTGAGKAGLIGGGGALIALLLSKLMGGGDTEIQGQELGPQQLLLMQRMQEQQTQQSLADALIESRMASAGQKRASTEESGLNAMLKMLQIKQLSNQIGGDFF